MEARFEVDLTPVAVVCPSPMVSPELLPVDDVETAEGGVVVEGADVEPVAIDVAELGLAATCVVGEIGAVEVEVVDWGLTAVEVIGSVTEGVSFGSVPNVRFVEFDE